VAAAVYWRRGVEVSGVRRVKLTHVGPGYYWVFGRVYHLGMLCNRPTRPTQPCIPPWSLNRVPAAAEVRVGMSHLPGGR